MPEPAQPKAEAEARRPRRWRRLLGRSALLAAALLVVFHQPILRAVLWHVVKQLAAQKQVQVSGDLRGSVWTQLTLQNFHAVSLGSVPFDTIEIDRLRLEYNLWELIRRGPAHAFTFYNIRNAWLRLAPVKGNTDEDKRLARLLRNLLQQPLIYSDRAQIENFNMTVRTGHGLYVWNDIHALLDPQRPGYIRIGQLDLPGCGSWRKLYAKATYVDRHLVLRNFDVGREVHGARLEIDGSHRDEGVGVFSFEGTVLSGDLGLYIWERNPPGGKKRRMQIDAYLANLPLPALARYLGWKVPLEGPVREASLSLSGNPGKPLHWRGNISLAAEQAKVAGFAVDEASAQIALEDGCVWLRELSFATGKNRLSLKGEYRLPKKWADLRLDGLEGTFALDAPDLHRLNPALTGGTVVAHGTVGVRASEVRVEGSGQALEVKGDVFGLKQAALNFNATRPLPVGAGGDKGKDKGDQARPWYDGLAGSVRLEAGDLYFHQFFAKKIAFDMPVEKGRLRLQGGTLDLNGRDGFAGEGWVALAAPHAYEASLKGSVEDVALFQPFFKTPLGGALEIDWHGSGQIALLRHRGEGKITFQHGFLGRFTGIDGELAGSYSPESAEIATLRLKSDQGSLETASVKLLNERLRVEGLRLAGARGMTVSGGFSFPLDLRTPTKPETLLPADGPLRADLTLEPVDLGQRFPASKPGLAVKGSLQGGLKASGTLGSPEVTLDFLARGLQSGAAEKLAPANGAARVVYKGGRVALSGSLAQPGLSPLVFHGALPLDLRKTLQSRRLDPATPIAGSVKLPPSSAGVFAPFLPGVRFLEGRMSVDAAIRGTLGKPVYSGGVALNLSALRFRKAEIPGVDRFLCDLRFNGNELTFQRFSGEVAGGNFSVAGKVKLESLANPQLDLRLQSQGTLLARNDTLTLRSNADLRFTGPLASANVSGKVGIAKSRFFRQVEILPIGLPGRPAPKPALSNVSFSTDVAPFRGWHYNVAVYTAEPFVVKGNLADGALQANLRLGGTGLAPTLDGTVWIDNLVASLPFSTLNVDHGAMYFSGNASLNPTLDVHGSSRIRDYNVNVYLYGTALEPNTLFTSEPSLPPEEVVTLLATGATTRDFQQNNEAAAGRAAALLFQDLYHKVFRRRTAVNSANPFDWFSLDVGGVDPRTGKQEITGKFKLTNAYQLAAGVDIQGDMRLQLQYLIRFR